MLLAVSPLRICDIRLDCIDIFKSFHTLNSKKRKNTHVHHSFFIPLNAYVYYPIDKYECYYMQYNHNDREKCLVFRKNE